MSEVIFISVLILLAAMLYSSVGHGGASGYLAVMALFSIAPATMRPTALILNICVSSIAAVKFARKGFFSWHRFYPFALASVPFAFVGGSITLPADFFKPVLGIILLVAAVMLARRETHLVQSDDNRKDRIPVAAALACGAALGLLSGLTGVGGGIFLSPLLLFMGWSDVRQTAAISAFFILVNSIAGLGANLVKTDVSVLPYWYVLLAFGVAAVAGGHLGSSYGSDRAKSSLTLRRLLALVLVIAAVKLILT